MKGIYLSACKAHHPKHDIVYQDIDPRYGCDLGGDMLEVDLSPYDYIIATPPCNWWSQANPYYWRSEYSLKTRHLLPLMLIKLGGQRKPFILECVRNLKDIRKTTSSAFARCMPSNIKSLGDMFTSQIPMSMSAVRKSRISRSTEKGLTTTDTIKVEPMFTLASRNGWRQ